MGSLLDVSVRTGGNRSNAEKASSACLSSRDQKILTACSEKPAYGITAWSDGEGASKGWC
jgi:hypothetical protein